MSRNYTRTPKLKDKHGHDLNMVYMRTDHHAGPTRLNKYLYCVKCDKFFHYKQEAVVVD